MKYNADFSNFINSLEKTLVLMNIGIWDIEYYCVDDYFEKIIINFDDGCKKEVNVSDYSNYAMVLDVMKALK